MPVSPELLAELLDAHAASLELYARQWSHAPPDVVQEAFLRLARLPGPPDRPTAWLFAVVRNLAISDRRAASRRQRHETAAATSDWFEPDSSGGLDADAAARALSELEAETREVVVAHLWGGLTFGEIGDLIGRSSSTAHRRYLEGIETLRKQLGGICPK